MKCAGCSETNLIKYGSYKHIQKYKCNNCGRQATQKSGASTESKIRVALALDNLGLSQSAIEQILNVNRSTIYRWGKSSSNLMPAPKQAIQKLLHYKSTQIELQEKDLRLINNFICEMNPETQKKAIAFFTKEMEKNPYSWLNDFDFDE